MVVLRIAHYQQIPAGEFGREKVSRINCFQAFGEKKFGELIDQQIGYQL